MITGKTKVVIHLCHPSDHVRTPQLFNQRCKERGWDAVLVPWDVEPENLETIWKAMLKSRSVAGAIVTIPHKQTMARLCDRLDGDAADLGVVNVVRKEPSGTTLGVLHDGFGFVVGLRAHGIEPKGKRVLLLGAGGAATAIAHALAKAGIAEIAIHNRTETKAAQMVERLSPLHPGVSFSVGSPMAGKADLIVNATSLGMHGVDPLPMDVQTLHPGVIVAEIIMSPAMTPLLVCAQERGAQIHLGEPMLSAQIDLFIDALFPQ